MKKRIKRVVRLYQYHMLNEAEIEEELLTKLPEIDEIISRNLVNYTLKRLNLVDLAIIENAVYEMQYLKIPKEIAINEAVEISKLLTEIDEYQSAKFNNKLLDTIAKDLKL